MDHQAAKPAEMGAVSIRAHIGHFGLAVMIVLLAAHDNFMDVAKGLLVDPDSYMRLIRIREALGHGNWFGYVVSHDASGLGAPVRWSHELDIGILLLRAPLSVIMPPEAALFWAGAILGPVCVGLLGVACAWAIAPIAAARWRWAAAAAVAGASPIIGYGQLGQVTHHIAIAVFVIAAWGAAGRAAFGDRRGAALMGLFAALGIWLTPETMPFAMMAFGAVFLAWTVDPRVEVAQALERAGTVLLLVTFLAFAVDPPSEGLTAIVLDRLSIPFVCLALLVFLLCRLPRIIAAAGRSLLVRATILFAAGAAAVAIWLALFPGYLKGLDSLMTAEETQAVAPYIAEWQPLDTPLLFLTVAGAGTLAGFAALILAFRHRRDGVVAALWAFAGIGDLGCVVLAALHLRFATYPAAAGAMMLPILLSQVKDEVATGMRLLRESMLIVAFLIVPLVAGRLYEPAPVYSALGDDEAAAAPRCPLPAAFRLLAPYSGAIVAADLNIGPDLLYHTQVKIVGSIYIWNIGAFMRLRAVWRARDLDEVPAELRAAGAHYVLACRGTERSPFVDGPETTLFDRLNRGDPPKWLQPVAQADGTGWVLYQVPD